MGFVACRVTSKILGIGSAERSWGAVKHLKTDKRSHMSGPVTKQQATLFGAASIKASQARRNALENHPTAVRKLWSDEDLAFDLQLSAWGVDISSLASQKPARIFRAWLEQWEQDSLKKNDPVMEARLLEKYRDLVFFDPDTGHNFMVGSDSMIFQGGRKGAGWCVNGIRDDGEEEPWQLELVIGQVVETTQPAELNVEVLRHQEGDESLDISGDSSSSD